MVVLTGGFASTGYLGLAERYNLETGLDATLPSLQEPRLNHGCTAYNAGGGDSVIVAGGWRAGYIDSVEILTPGGSAWQLVQSLPQMRLFSAMGVISGNPVIIGGGQYSSGWQMRDMSLMYHPDQDNWTEIWSLGPGKLMRQVMFNVPQ